MAVYFERLSLAFEILSSFSNHFQENWWATVVRLRLRQSGTGRIRWLTRTAARRGSTGGGSPAAPTAMQTGDSRRCGPPCCGTVPEHQGQCEDLLDALAAEDDNPPAPLPTLFFPGPPAGCFRREVRWLGRNSVQTSEELNAIQSPSSSRTWNSSADRCA